MRFYIGFSKKIPLKWFITAILGILAFFGFTKVHALEVSDLNLDYSYDLGNNTLITVNCNGTVNQSTWTFNNSVYIGSDNRYLVFNISEWSIGATDENSNNRWNYFFTIANTGAYELFNSNGASVLCDKHNGYVICPLQKGKTYTHITINVMAPGISCSGDTTSTFRVYSSRWAYVYLNPVASQNNTIINNQQQIIDSQNDTNDLLNDDSTSESSSSASSFFNDFEVDDSKGITNVVTAPLRFLEGLLTYTPYNCSNLDFDLTMADDNISQTKALSLPCGQLLWSRVPHAVETTYNVFIWGLLAYRVLIGLLKFFNDTLNPEKDKEYYLDL